MRSFHFPLERVLRWRRNEFEAEELRLTMLLDEQQRLESARQQIRAAGERAGRQLMTAGTLDGGDLEALSRYRERLDRDREHNERQQRDAGQRIVDQRARLLAARRRVRLLEKLRGRRRESWQVQWDRELEDFAGEAFLARWQPPS